MISEAGLSILNDCGSGRAIEVIYVTCWLHSYSTMSLPQCNQVITRVGRFSIKIIVKRLAHQEGIAQNEEVIREQFLIYKSSFHITSRASTTRIVTLTNVSRNSVLNECYAERMQKCHAEFVLKVAGERSKGLSFVFRKKQLRLREEGSQKLNQ